MFLLTLSFDANACKWCSRDGLALMLTMGESRPSLSSEDCKSRGEWLSWLEEWFVFPFLSEFKVFVVLLLLLFREVDGIKLFWQGVDDGGGITIFEKSHDLGDNRDRSVWWDAEPDCSDITFERCNGGEGWESGEEFLILPIESDSVADVTESSTLNRDSPSALLPIAWSAISEIRIKIELKLGNFIIFHNDIKSTTLLKWQFVWYY